MHKPRVLCVSFRVEWHKLTERGLEFKTRKGAHISSKCVEPFGITMASPINHGGRRSITFFHICVVVALGIIPLDSCR